VAAFCWSAAPAAARSAGPPGGFRLPAGNGYSIHVLTFDGDQFGNRDVVILFVRRKGAGATYFALKRVHVTETTVTADLGSLGAIDLHFVPTGGTTTETSECDSEPIEFDSGFYEGRFDFEGEEGYTEAHVTRARGRNQPSGELDLRLRRRRRHRRSCAGCSPGREAALGEREGRTRSD
jgi:hypothetical protein